MEHFCPDTLTASLQALASAHPHRFHMPGHKGILPPPFDRVARIDMTELSQTGNLYTEREGHIRQAEGRCAALYGAAEAQFLTGGATQGVFALLSAFARPGDTVAVDRGSHRSVYAAMALLDLRPHYLTRKRLTPYGIGAALEPEPLQDDTACVMLTCPTYYGVRSPNRDWRTGSGKPVPVLIDAAHGAHLPFLPGGANPLDGARAAVCSAHKTLPALGQAAFLLLRDAGDGSLVRDRTALFGTASPSYPILASMDSAFDTLKRELWAETAEWAEILRAECPGLLAEMDGVRLDAARLCLYTGDGYRDALRLEREQGILCEMADQHNVVFILTPNDPPKSRQALQTALRPLSAVRRPLSTTSPFPLPTCAATLREALFGPSEPVRLAAAAGRVAARALAPYPPGIPLVAPGEVIDKIHVEILRDLWYDEGEEDFCVEAMTE